MPTLDWIGKQAVTDHHRKVPYRLLHCDKKLSVGDAAAPGGGSGGGNLLVQGDNLLALKALLPYYAGKVKCIYIDPPYNTGNEEWVYNDNVNSPEIRDWLNKTVGKEAEDLCRHDKWLCMMYPRLALLREFLTEDGILFVSLDDNELVNLLQILDEMFGRSNRIGTIVWKNATDNNPTQIVPEHEYVVCYAKSRSMSTPIWKAQTLGVKQKLLDIGEELTKTHKDDAELQTAYTKWFRKNKAFLWPLDRYKYIDRGGVYTGSQSVHNPGKEGYRYDVIHPTTGRPCKLPLMGYRFPPDTMTDLLKNDRVLFGETEDKVIELKVYAKDYKSKLASVFELDGRKGTYEIKAVFPESKRPFNFPKPTGLIEELLAFTTGEDDYILDSFAGSGTTAQATMQLNKADGGNRKFILVEMDENICRDVTAQRLQRVIEGRPSGGKGKDKGLEALGGGFRFCTLGKELFDATGVIDENVKFNDLAAHVFFAETGSPIPKRPRKNDPLIGEYGGTRYYLLFNGVLGDRSVNGGNILTRATLEACGEDDGSLRVIYGEGCRLAASTLKRLNVRFKQLPYDVKVS